jgi:two-component system nitrogen regulation sensor histidine kinase GlnL
MNNKYIFIVDTNLSIESWSRKMERLCYKSEDNVIGEKLNKVFPWLNDEIALVLNDGRERNVRNLENECFMGTDLSADAQIVPVKNEQNRVTKVIVSLDNVSGECPLAKKLDDSERLISMGKVASSIAHGVRNPLNAIKGSIAYLTEKYGKEPTFLEFSEIINEEINKLDKFVSNFLSNAKGCTDYQSVNINDTLESIIKMVQPRAKMQGVEILQSFSTVPLLSIDQFQIEQALLNITNNTFEAMPAGGSIQIRTSQAWEKDKSFVVIEIADTGKGIPATELDTLGEIINTKANKERGFGIFLSREVIKSHNGKLMWESVPGKGTTFRIFLPVTNDEQP